MKFQHLGPISAPQKPAYGWIPERSCERCHLRPWGRRGRRGRNGDLWVFPWKICRTPGHSTRIDGTSWRWGNVKKNTMWTLVLYCHPPKIDRTPNNFKILMISMICRLRVVEFILSRLPDDVIFGSAKDLVPTAQMMYNSSEQICGCFHFFFEPCLSQWQWVWKWVFCHNLWPFSEDGNFGKSLNRVSFR